MTKPFEKDQLEIGTSFGVKKNDTFENIMSSNPHTKHLIKKLNDGMKEKIRFKVSSVSIFSPGHSQAREVKQLVEKTG